MFVIGFTNSGRDYGNQKHYFILILDEIWWKFQYYRQVFKLSILSWKLIAQWYDF